jgi:hypothetical protein
VRETRVFVERVLEVQEYRVLSDERGGAVQTGTIEKEGRQYKSRTTYSESCWGKCMRMSAADSRQERKKKNTNLRRKGWLALDGCVLLPRLNDASRRYLSHPLHARPRSQATASSCRCVLSAHTPLIFPIYTVHDCTTISPTRFL